MSSNPVRLWVVATPLGNPGDFSPRARIVLGDADLVLAEDTRRAGLLFARCGLEAKRFVSLHEHNEAKRLPQVLEELQSGKVAALISDAGTPLLSDPGFRLVRACREAGLRVSPVPGPSAPLAALCASGLPPQPFVFLGFPPRKAGEQESFFAPYAALDATLIFFERKDRVAETLARAHGVLGPREACIARELTKTYEEFIVFRLGGELPFVDLLGELTIILGPPEKGERTPQREVSALLAQKASQGLKPRELARLVQGEVCGWTAKDVYRLLQETEDGSAPVFDG